MGLKLIGEVALDGSGFERGLHSMADSVKGFIAGAFGLYGVEAMIHKTVDTAKELVTESKRLGIGVEQLQVLKQAAKENSAEFDTLTKAFEKLDQAREKANRGSKEGMKLMGRFEQLGISKDDLQSRTAADLFKGPIAEKAKTMNPEDLGPILRDILGKGFGELLPVLGTDFEALEKKMRSLGTIMDTETAAKLKVIEGEFSILGNIIAVKLGPALISLFTVVTKAVGGLQGLWAFLQSLIKDSPNNPILGAAMMLNPLTAIASTISGLAADENEKPVSLGEAFTNAMNAAGDAVEPTSKFLDDMQAQFDKLIEELKNPAKPTFDVPDETPEKKQKRTKERAERSDELLKVGNFLGSSRSVLEDIASRQLGLLEKIEANTRPEPIGSGGTSDDDFPST